MSMLANTSVHCEEPLSATHVVSLDGLMRIRLRGCLAPGSTAHLRRTIRPPASLFVAHLRAAFANL